jgi:hypothetical protein
MAVKLSEGVKKLLEAPNFANLATLMPDGSPQVRPSGWTSMGRTSW